MWKDRRKILCGRGLAHSDLGIKLRPVPLDPGCLSIVWSPWYSHNLLFLFGITLGHPLATYADVT